MIETTELEQIMLEAAAVVVVVVIEVAPQDFEGKCFDVMPTEQLDHHAHLNLEFLGIENID